MREQAKKMNVTSLRSNKDGDDVSAEFKLAKVSDAIILFLVFCIDRLERK